VSLVREQQPVGRYRLPRSGATDRGNLTDLATVGLAYRDPNLLQPGGARGAIPALVAAPAATAENLGGRQTGRVAAFTRTGRPALQHDVPFDPVTKVSPSVDAGPGPVLASGTVRRNVEWPLLGGGGRGEFSGTANGRPGGPGRAFEVTPVDEYIISSLHLQLPLPLSAPVAGVKPPILNGPDATHRNRLWHARSSGWPVVAPSVPSFSARVPLVRPRNLVSAT